MERRTKILCKNIFSGCLILFIIGLFYLLVVTVFFMGWDDYFLPNPSAPTICNGEFPFEIIFTLNGEKHTLRDTYVCNYVGVEIHGGGVLGGQGEKRRSWNGYVKSTGNKEAVLYEDDKVKMYCEFGAPGYYMGDMKYVDEAEAEIYLEDYENRRIYSNIFGREDIKELCDAELISFEIAEPLENEFRYTFKSIFAWVE